MQHRILDDVLDLIIDHRGKTATKLGGTWENEGTPVISANNIRDGQFIEMDSTKHIKKELFKKWMPTSLEEGDVLLVSEGATFGEVLYLRKGIHAALGQRLFALRCNDSYVGRYLYYYLKSRDGQNELGSKTTGTSVLGIRQSELRKIRVPNVDKDEQKAVAKMMGSIDDKISLNFKTNVVLEAIGQAIFKHWFVDFEFPNEDGKPYTSSGGEMVYNEELEKEIPKGWRVGSFSDVIAVNPKRGLPKGRTATKVGMADLNPWQSWIQSWSSDEYKSGPKFKNGDTLFARITPSLEHGKTAFVSILSSEEVAFGSTEFIVFGKKLISSESFIFHLARSDKVRNAAIGAMTGTSGRQRVPDDLFDHLLIILPPSMIIDQFEKASVPQFERISSNARETRILTQIRDSLLPKLMSGKIRVPAEAR